MTPPPEQDGQQLVLTMLFEIRERLVAIETRQEDSTDARDKATEALALSKENEKDIAEVKESKRWTDRLMIGLVAAAIVNFILNAIQGL